MNDIVKSENLEPSQIVTLKPEKYVAEVFSPFKKQLAKAIKESKGVTYDITTNTGMDAAKKMRASFRTIRLDAEKTRKERKAPIIEIGKLLDTRYKEFEAEVSPHEDMHDAAIKAEDERREAIKQEAIAKERARIEAIENRINNIRALPARYLQASSAEIIRTIEQQSTLVLDPADYDELHEVALAALNAALVELERMRRIAVEREAEAARVEAERAELARMKAEEKARVDAAAAQAAEQARIIAELQAQLAAATKAQAPAPAVDLPAEVVILTEAPPCKDFAGEVVDAAFVEVSAPLPPPLPTASSIVSCLMTAFDLPREAIVTLLQGMDFSDL